MIVLLARAFGPSVLTKLDLICSFSYPRRDTKINYYLTRGPYTWLKYFQIWGDFLGSRPMPGAW